MKSRFIRWFESLEQRRLLTAGDLDLTFGTGGKVLTDFPATTNDAAMGAVFQPGGKAVILTPNGLARYKSDGSPDASFGSGGTAPIATYRPNALALLPDNSIIVLGYPLGANADDFVLARYTADGAADLSFGGGATNVVVNPRFGGPDTFGESISLILVQSDGKIVVAGTASSQSWGFADDFAVARYNPDGSPDNYFGGTIASTTLADFDGYDHLQDITLLPDGDVLAVGATASFSSHHPYARLDFAFARFDSNGGLDRTFGGGDGMATDNFGSYPTDNPFAESPNNSGDRGTSVVALPDGRFVVVGESYNLPEENYRRIAVARYLADGTLDTSFSPGGADPTAANPAATGGPGHLLLTDHISDNPRIVRQSNGKLVLAATASGDFALITRLTPNGDWDPTFGHAATADDLAVITDFGHADLLSSVLITPDNKLLAAGGANDAAASTSLAALARYVLEPAPVSQSPFGGTPISLPGTVEAENYDTGGEGVAYHDSEPANLGGVYRINEAVDIQASPQTGNGHIIGFAKQGEWTEYTVNVPAACKVDLVIRYAALKAGGRFHLVLCQPSTVG